ncbi:unnamed protein product [Rhizopus microsporus]|uniref:SH3 domain-containing protein n=1 Tax=Rhizopus microsporus TaxID=58291 RepID=A0A0A1P376_RHIZD|nr:hypothetical protein BCV71DRAFT_193286 [Rhizopus microsporus]CEI99225.1 Putative High osmolarity signaling protein SHO1 [Rhizopus microsporus]
MSLTLRDQPFVLSTLLLAAIGWMIAFVGACMLKVLNGVWWIMLYELLIIAAQTMMTMSGSVEQYRVTMMTLLATSVPLLTIQIDYVIQSSRSNLSRAPANTYTAGYIILIIMQYVWILIFGSDKSTFFGRWGQANRSIRKEGVIVEKDDRSKRIVPVILTEPCPPSVGTDFVEKVQALHTYQANSEDPNELSFEKGEILEVADRKGNWWQAKKSDGTIGIIPSNYFIVVDKENV